MRIEKRSIYSGKVNTMDLPITDEQLARWQNGELIQNVMPKLSAAEREFLISGCTPEDWEAMFGSPED